MSFINTKVHQNPKDLHKSIAFPRKIHAQKCITLASPCLQFGIPPYDGIQAKALGKRRVDLSEAQDVNKYNYI